MTATITSPKDLLLKYQRRWVDDHARFKMGLWARQTGKDFSSSEEAIEDAIAGALARRRVEWTIFAAGERQALESMSKAKDWAQAYNIAISDYLEERNSLEAILKVAEVRIGDWGLIRALPAKPETARGYSSNMIITEFDFIDRQQEFWRAVYPIITNPLRGGEKKVRIITTPNGKDKIGYRIWTEGNTWSKHKVTIHDAVADGLPVNIEELRAGLNDPEGWAQEYECEFIDSSTVLLPYDLIASAESAEATEANECPEKARPGLYCGIDFGRQNDPTVCWMLERIGDILWTREVLVLAGMDVPAQQEILRQRIAVSERVSFDYTGPGVGLGDWLAKEHGEWKPSAHAFGKVELCTFTLAFKREIFPRLRRLFEAPVKVRVPISRSIREDLHAMQQTVHNGQYDYWAPRTREGHSDRCTALALAARAAGDGGASVGVAIG